MNSYTGLPATGFAATVAGYTLGGIDLLIGAAALVTAGAIALRFGWRRDKAVSSR